MSLKSFELSIKANNTYWWQRSENHLVITHQAAVTSRRVRRTKLLTPSKSWMRRFQDADYREKCTSGTSATTYLRSRGSPLSSPLIDCIGTMYFFLYMIIRVTHAQFPTRATSTGYPFDFEFHYYEIRVSY